MSSSESSHSVDKSTCFSDATLTPVAVRRDSSLGVTKIAGMFNRFNGTFDVYDGSGSVSRLGVAKFDVRFNNLYDNESSSVLLDVVDDRFCGTDSVLTLLFFDELVADLFIRLDFGSSRGILFKRGLLLGFGSSREILFNRGLLLGLYIPIILK